VVQARTPTRGTGKERVTEWLAEHHPEIVSYADVTRDHCLAWAQDLTESPAETTGKPLLVPDVP